MRLKGLWLSRLAMFALALTSRADYAGSCWSGKTL